MLVLHAAWLPKIADTPARLALWGETSAATPTRRGRGPRAKTTARPHPFGASIESLSKASPLPDLGARADPRKLARAAAVYENSTARRLGYLLEYFGHARQAASLHPLARKAKSLKPLDPSVRLVVSLARSAKAPEAPTWKLSLNVPLEIDA